MAITGGRDNVFTVQRTDIPILQRRQPFIVTLQYDSPILFPVKI